MPSKILIILTVSFALFSLFFLLLTVNHGRKRKILATTRSLILAILMILLSALFGAIRFSVYGYQTLIREELAATVFVTPVSKQKFDARFILPNGDRQTFTLAGDQLYVDAHILKWKPIANLFGLHTSYELDRVSGRYTDLNDERTRVHTYYSLSPNNVFNIFDLRRKFALLSPLLDAEYGSASFINSNHPAVFRIMVSQTGLLIRKSPNQANTINDEQGIENK